MNSGNGRLGMGFDCLLTLVCYYFGSGPKGGLGVFVLLDQTKGGVVWVVVIKRVQLVLTNITRTKLQKLKP